MGLKHECHFVKVGRGLEAYLRCACGEERDIYRGGDGIPWGDTEFLRRAARPGWPADKPLP